MPFRSKLQVKYLYARHPDIARRFRLEYPNQNLKTLPLRVRKIKKISDMAKGNGRRRITY